MRLISAVERRTKIQTLRNKREMLLKQRNLQTKTISIEEEKKRLIEQKRKYILLNYPKYVIVPLLMELGDLEGIASTLSSNEFQKRLNRIKPIITTIYER